MSILKAMGTMLKKQLLTSSKLKSLTKADFLDIIDSNMKTHETIAMIKNSFTKSELNEVYNRYKNNMQFSKSKSKGIPIDYASKLMGSAKSDEISNRMSIILDVNKKFIKILQELKSHLDELINQENVNVFNCRLSHVAVFGILKESELFGTYTTYMWNQIVKLDDIPKYRSDYLVAHYSDYVKILNTINNKTGKYYFIPEIDQMKKRDVNLKLYDSNTDQTVDTYVRPNDFSSATLTHFSFGGFFFNIFSWIGETFDDWRHSRYIKNERLKEWMEQHNAILKLELNEANPNSEEYIRKKKITEYWDDELSKIDRKINTYLGE
jgi:hypothetical protein